jgi:hypothetical protein
VEDWSAVRAVEINRLDVAFIRLEWDKETLRKALMKSLMFAVHVLSVDRWLLARLIVPPALLVEEFYSSAKSGSASPW